MSLHEAFIGRAKRKNSGKGRRSSIARWTMTDPSEILREALSRLDDPSGRGDLMSSGRVQLARVKDGLATIVVEAGGLAAEGPRGARAADPRRLIGVPGVTDTRIAMTVEKRERTIVAVGSGKGGVGKSTLSPTSPSR
jgi:ATP-binding protein involved in chromosome partitioning